MKKFKKAILSSLLSMSILSTIPFSNLNVCADYTLGDVDGSGIITIQDAYLTLLYYSKESAGVDGEFSSAQKNAADVNKDNTVNITDAYLILLYYSYDSVGNGKSFEEIANEKPSATATKPTDSNYAYGTISTSCPSDTTGWYYATLDWDGNGYTSEHAMSMSDLENLGSLEAKKIAYNYYMNSFEWGIPSTIHCYVYIGY